MKKLIFFFREFSGPGIFNLKKNGRTSTNTNAPERSVHFCMNKGLSHEESVKFIETLKTQNYLWDIMSNSSSDTDSSHGSGKKMSFQEISTEKLCLIDLSY